VKFRHPWLVQLAGIIFASGLRVVFRTLSLRLITTPDANPYSSRGPKRYLFCVWHDSAVIAAFGGKHDRTVALTSRHRDGLFVATVARMAGVSAVRGSTGVTGGRALRELLRLADQNDIVITPDGPRGPRRTMSRGMVYLASRTGNAIVPTAFACSRCWHIPGRWSTLLVPIPFSRVILLAGEPIPVAPRVESHEIDHYVSTVQRAMDELDVQAKAFCAESTPIGNDLPLR
jgi:lysophospholipid acyltransferase (LPLAT)-like uncharacterized protein